MRWIKVSLHYQEETNGAKTMLAIHLKALST